ncbi:MAG: MoxR family ATPase [Bacteroidetes bacterium]|nr:MAG: MoxR family ATPase [Bacteroidota bacterium]
MLEEQLIQPSAETEAIRVLSEAIQAEIAKIIVGQDQMVELMIAAILADGHILVEGVPGVAKTLTSKLLARSIEAHFSRIQFTPDLMPSDVLGTTVFNTRSGEFEFRKGPIFAQVVLIDEINRAPAKTQAALFEVMEERQVTIDGHTHAFKAPFVVIATQNPIEQEGTYRLPEAQLDRFIFKIEVDYPNLTEEVRILGDLHERRGVNDISAIQPVATAEQLRLCQDIVRGLHIDTQLREYIVKIVSQTRNHKDIYLGASPRASVNIMNASKAIAGMRGRSFVTPEDIRLVTAPVLRHRIILTPEQEMEGGTPEEVIRRIVEQVEVPR